MMSKIVRFYPEVIGALLCLMLGIFSGYSVNAGHSLWYANLTKPFFNPPSWLFGPVWSLLYVMMGVALGRLWKDKHKNKYLILIFAMQLVFNLSWSPIFFYFEKIGLALLDICFLWGSLALLMFLARKKLDVFILFVPYILWVTLAFVLNFKIYQMN